MKIKNKDGKSWISKYYNPHKSIPPTINIVNCEVETVELKGDNLIIRVKK